MGSSAETHGAFTCFFEMILKLPVDQSIENHAGILLNSPDDLIQLSLRPDKIPGVFLRMYIGKLDDTGARQITDGFAGGIGYKVKVKRLHEK